MQTPRVEINLNKIQENAEIMKKKCKERGIELAGVVKGAAGDIKVARAFVRGGINMIGDSRLKNIISFREAGFKEQMLLLRLPRLVEAEEVVKYTDISLNSEVFTIKALSRAAEKLNKLHNVIVMVDVGDLREGVLQEDLETFFSQVIDLPGINILGLGTNVGCYGGVLPSRDNTHVLVNLQQELENKFFLNLEFISGGNTATTVLFADNSLATGINHLRIGEAILQGSDITNQRNIDYLNQDNFMLVTSIIELKEKPSVPWGNIGHDAFGNKPQFTDKGIRKRAILAIGRQDVKVDGLTPELKNIGILGASSDHLLIDVTDSPVNFKVGDEIKFHLNYGAMLSVMTSSYVKKEYI